MVKNTTLREDKVLKSLKEAYPTYSFGIKSKDDNYLDMARLIQPLSFDYKNRSRLELEFTKQIKQALYDITLLMQYLSKKNKSDILTSQEFNEHMKRIMDLSKHGQVDEDYTVSFYSNMIQFGVNGITQNMPREFTPLIEEHLKPLTRLLTAITAYSKQVGKKGESAFTAFYDLNSTTL